MCFTESKATVMHEALVSCVMVAVSACGLRVRRCGWMRRVVGAVMTRSRKAMVVTA